MNRRKKSRLSAPQPTKRQYPVLSLGPVVHNDSYGYTAVSHQHKKPATAHAVSQQHQKQAPHTPIRENVKDLNVVPATPLSKIFQDDPNLLDNELLLIDEEAIEQRRRKRKFISLNVPETPMTMKRESNSQHDLDSNYPDVIPCSIESSSASYNTSMDQSYNTSVSQDRTDVESQDRTDVETIGPVARVLSYPLEVFEEDWPTPAVVAVDYQEKQSVSTVGNATITDAERIERFEQELATWNLFELLGTSRPEEDDDCDYFERNHAENRSASPAASASENNNTQETDKNSQLNANDDSLSSDFDEECATQILERPWHEEPTPVTQRTQPIDPIQSPHQRSINHSEVSTQVI